MTQNMIYYEYAPSHVTLKVKAFTVFTFKANKFLIQAYQINETNFQKNQFHKRHFIFILHYENSLYNLMKIKFISIRSNWRSLKKE